MLFDTRVARELLRGHRMHTTTQLQGDVRESHCGIVEFQVRPHHSAMLLITLFIGMLCPGHV